MVEWMIEVKEQLWFSHYGKSIGLGYLVGQSLESKLRQPVPCRFLSNTVLETIEVRTFT